MMQEIAHKVILHVAAAHSTQAVVAHRLDYTPEVIVIQRGGMPRVTTQDTRFRRSQMRSNCYVL